MVAVSVDDNSLQTDAQPRLLAWSESQQILGTVPYSLAEPTTLS